MSDPIWDELKSSYIRLPYFVDMPATAWDGRTVAHDYWTRLSEISASPDSRLCRTRHHGQHETTYYLELEGAFFPVVAKTIQMMEVTYSR